ncbi:hypothetical protein IM538_03960 [Cytobacillus suaedae]|nr:hypothetical protein IM538_03960 [Cytobacillus suaedae]
MFKKVFSFMVLIMYLSACQQDTEDNKNIQEGVLYLDGKSSNWEVRANIKTRVSVTTKNNSVIVIPLESKGVIDLKSNSLYENDIEVEYFLERFEAEGKEILIKGEKTLKLFFESEIPPSDDKSDYEFTIKWIQDGEEKEETIVLN